MTRIDTLPDRDSTPPDDHERALRAEIVHLTGKYGHAALVLELAAAVGWQGRYASSIHEKPIAKAAEMLAKSAEILERIEVEQQEFNEWKRENQC